MKKKMSMAAIKGNAAKKGFGLLLNKSGKSAKQYGCMSCHKNTAVKFSNGKITVIACPCGWRKKGKA
jgi:DNA-directed RNA polymerase subunit RPC12/RpoP